MSDVVGAVRGSLRRKGNRKETWRFGNKYIEYKVRAPRWI
jgi:hypothetical protein